MKGLVFLATLLALCIFLGRPCQGRPWSSEESDSRESERQEDTGFFRSIYRRFLDPSNPSSFTSRVGRFFTGIYNFFRRTLGYDDDEKTAPPKRPNFEVPPPPNYPARPRPTQPPTEPPVPEEGTKAPDSREELSSIPPNVEPFTVGVAGSSSAAPEEPSPSNMPPLDSPSPAIETEDDNTFSPSSGVPSRPSEQPSPPEEVNTIPLRPSDSSGPSEEDDSIAPSSEPPLESNDPSTPSEDENFNTILPNPEAPSRPEEPSSPPEGASSPPGPDNEEPGVNIIPLDTENRPNPLDTNIPSVIASQEDYDINSIPDDTNLYVHVKDV